MQLVEYSKRSITRNNTGLVAPLINCNYELMKIRLNKSVNVTEISKIITKHQYLKLKNF